MSLARVVASGGGLGWLPGAPGTWASLTSVLAGAGLLALSPWALAAGAVAATLGGLWAITSEGVGGDDPGWVVIDEVAGQWITMLALPRPAPLWLLAAFLVFRTLDIAKPGPIGWADRRHDAVGVMADDVIAGAVGAALLLGARVAHM